jgi:hypothetical protein
VRTPKSGVGLARSQGRGQAAGTSSSHRAGSDDHRTRNWIDEQLRFPGAQASRTFRPGGTAASGVVWPTDPARSSCQYRAITPGQRRSDRGHHGYMKPQLSGADVMLRTPSKLVVRPPRPPVILAVAAESRPGRQRSLREPGHSGHGQARAATRMTGEEQGTKPPRTSTGPPMIAVPLACH